MMLRGGPAERETIPTRYLPPSLIPAPRQRTSSVIYRRVSPLRDHVEHKIVAKEIYTERFTRG